MKFIILMLILVGCTEPETVNPELQEHINECGPGVVEGVEGENRCAYTVDTGGAFNTPYEEKTGLKIPANWLEIASFNSLKQDGELPLHFDWRDHARGLCKGEKQGSCGSCWMFGTMHVMQDVLRLSQDKACVDISAQWGVDCNPADFSGCGGGYFAFKKFTKAYGAVYTSDYGPYLAKNRRCRPAKVDYDKTATIESWHYVGSREQNQDRGPSVTQMKNAIYNYGPIAITESAFAGGVKGVYHRCKRASGTNHITSLIGWSYIDEDLYWIRRNSWSGTGDKHYGVLTVKATSRKGDKGYKCANMGRSAAYVVVEGFPTPE